MKPRANQTWTRNSDGALFTVWANKKVWHRSAIQHCQVQTVTAYTTSPDALEAYGDNGDINGQPCHWADVKEDVFVFDFTMA